MKREEAEKWLDDVIEHQKALEEKCYFDNDVIYGVTFSVIHIYEGIEKLSSALGKALSKRKNEEYIRVSFMYKNYEVFQLNKEVENDLLQ